MARVTAKPKVDRQVVLHDGRLLAYAEWGQVDGTPVILLHGTHGSRLFCPDEDATDAMGVRLITIDRPGYGRSDPCPGRSLVDWVSDYAELAELIGLPPSPMIGWSGGGPYALACASLIPDRIPAVGLAASDGPLDEVPGAWDALSDDARALIKLLRNNPTAALDEIRKRCQWYADDWEVMFADVGSHPGDPDDQLLSRPEILQPIKVWMREGARQGVAGYMSDWIAGFAPWGFSPANLTTGVHVWWGEADNLVDRSHAEYLSATIRRSTLLTYPGEGHLFPVNHWADMLTALL